ncbi:sister chromatid cohesion 1 protein 1 [Corylus avellana]|uniref:sister chromatid cohesion 1 protein 1 n=1 Tax=Corylus avellana TaxID=13451 RepID=UPI00286A16E7|nr:sister chromatid cohesion 1 protein 1 [Corylus avellana]
MFYSHQLLARKAPLGQIWMAATLHAKINRRKLDKLNIIKICEEILNPSVPMALRLSGILMGGVVIVYERKVKLLYDDVSRLLVEINEAWKVKAAPDPTVLPKGKSHAKKEAVTLPENQETDVGDIEHSLHFSSTTATATMGFQQTAYFAMRLDSVDEPFINDNAGEEDQYHKLHQAFADNITLFERFDSYQANADQYNRFERFDIEGDGETELNFTSGEHTQIPTTLVPSPPLQDEPQRADEFHYQHPDHQVNQKSDGYKEARQDQERPRPKKRKTRIPAASIMDYEQTMIPGHVYQSWLQNASDIASRRGRKRKHTEIMSTMKIVNLMNLPPIVLIGDLFVNGSRAVYYPPPLLELWMKSIQPPHDSPSEKTSSPLPPEPSLSSPPERVHYPDPMGFPFEDFHSGVGSQSLGVSIEKQRANVVNNDIPTEILMEELRANLMNNGTGLAEVNLLVTPGNSDDVRSIPNSASGQGVFSHNSEVNSGRSNRKKPYSSSRHSSGGLEPVAEEHTWKHSDPKFKLARLSEKGLTPDQELLVETGVTQTQHEKINHPFDQITDSIRMQMKAHFNTPGAPQVESLNNLAAGMNRKGAALLFYQTCVLASSDMLRVEQMVPYADILISRGAKM